jgi:hypothetical protein
MTDPDFADATYVEPITAQVIEAIIAKERPDAILPTLGGQTALNAAMQLHEPLHEAEGEDGFPARALTSTKERIEELCLALGVGKRCPGRCSR